MRLHTGLAWVGTIALLSGCATTGALKRAQQQNADALAQASAQQKAALDALNADREPGKEEHSILRQEAGLKRERPVLDPLPGREIGGHWQIGQR